MGARWRRFAYLLTACLLIVWVGLFSALLVTFHPASSDWATYYDTARALRAAPHSDLWDVSATIMGSQQPGGCPLPWALPYKYPPLLAILVTPLTLLPCAAATLTWRIATLALWVACGAALALPAARASRRGWALAGLALTALYLPLLDGMLLGQSHLLILASVLAGATLVISGRETWGGAALAAGAWLKYLPGAVAFYYLLIGRWKVALGAAIAGILLLVAQVAVVGPASLLRSVNPSLFATTGAVWDGAPGGALWGLAAVAIFTAGVLVARRMDARRDADMLGVGWSLCTMLVASPVVQWFYLTWLLPAFWACLLETARIAREGAAARDWLRWAPFTVTLVILAVAQLSFNYVALSVVIVSLWALSGALYMSRAGLLAPLTARRSSQPAPNVA